MSDLWIWIYGENAYGYYATREDARTAMETALPHRVRRRLARIARMHVHNESDDDTSDGDDVDTWDDTWDGDE